MPRLGHSDENSKSDAHAQFLDLETQLLRLGHWAAQAWMLSAQTRKLGNSYTGMLVAQRLGHSDRCSHFARSLGLGIVLSIYYTVRVVNT